MEASKPLCLCGHPRERHIVPWIRYDRVHRCVGGDKLCDCRMFRTRLLVPPDHSLPKEKVAAVVRIVKEGQVAMGKPVWTTTGVRRKLLMAWPTDFSGGWDYRQKWLEEDLVEVLAALVLSPVVIG